jgi:hypothetical protein
MKNLTKEQKAKIIKQHFNELKSQNEIVSNTGINKRYVNEVCQAYAALKGLMGLDESEATPQVTLFPKTSSFKPAQRIDHTTPVQTPQQNNWGYPGSNTYELEYKDRRIKDLEQDKSDLRRKLDAIETDLAAKSKELQLLQLEHRTIERSHNLEVEFMRKMQELDKKPSTIDKILENETVQKMALAGIMGKMGMGDAAAGILGGAPSPQMEMPQVPTHPLTFNTEYSQKLVEIYELIAAFPPEKITPFHEILSLFFSIPNSLESCLTSMKKHLELKHQTPPQPNN